MNNCFPAEDITDLLRASHQNRQKIASSYSGLVTFITLTPFKDIFFMKFGVVGDSQKNKGFLPLHTVNLRTSRWPLTMFCNGVIDVGLAEYIVYMENNPRLKTDRQTTQMSEGFDK